MNQQLTSPSTQKAKKSVVITGADGFLGSVAVTLFKLDPSYTVIPFTGKLDLTSQKHTDHIAYNLQPDYLINYAAVACPQEFTLKDYATNVVITQNLLRSFSHYSRFTRCLFLSSTKVFGNEASKYVQFDELVVGYQDESTLQDPKCLYGQSKKTCNVLVKDSNLDCANIIQCGAEGVRPFGAPYLFSKIRGWARDAVNGNVRKLECEGVYKEFIHKEDAVLAHKAILESELHGNVVVGSGEPIYVYKMIEFLLGKFGIEGDAKELVGEPNSHKILLATNAAKLEKIGWRPKRSWESVLEELVDSEDSN